MQGKNMPKAVNSLNKDFKSLNQKPGVGLFYGKRKRYQEENETVEKPGTKGAKTVVKKVMKEYDDNGVLCFTKHKGNILINNIFQKDLNEIVSEQSNLNILPVSMDQTVYLEKIDKKAMKEN